MSATLLQMVNRARRKLKYEDVSSFVSSDDLSTVLIDLLNEAKRDVLENHEWDFDIRTDGLFQTVAPRTYTNTATYIPGLAVLSGTGASSSSYTGGALRARIRATEDATYGNTAFIVTSAETSGGLDGYTIETTWPGASAIGTGSLEVLVSEYVLPTTVRDVLTVTVEENDVLVEFVDKAETLDRCIPNAFDETSDIPEVCFVGGSTTPTVATGSTGTPGLGIWIYPVPASVYMVRYTYRYRHPSLSATTDTLQAPDHIIDDIVDLAIAKAMRTRVAPDLEAAQLLEATTRARISRSVRRTGSQPLQRMSLQSHDRRSGGIPLGGRPANPRVFYEP